MLNLDLDYEYSISEVADITGYVPHVLRYYEKEFDIDIPRNNSNHRYYTYKEIELFDYIKSLQEKGFSNKQIKLIINSPEILMTGQEENSIVAMERKDYLDTYQLAKEISLNLEGEFFDKLLGTINENTENGIRIIEDLRDEIEMLRNELNSKERDVLICENARLKMKLKEKTYEVVGLRNKITKLESEEGGFIRRLFKAK